MKKALPVVLALPLLLIMVMMGSVSNAKADDGPCLSGTPPEYAEVIKRAGSVCPLVTPSILAAQVKAESGWDPKVVSPVGAQGIAQFMPGTWASAGMDGDGDGKADVWNPVDAIWSQGNYMCNTANMVQARLDAGTITGDPLELTLAGYNAGMGNVEKYGGIPPFEETQNYVKKITEGAADFATGCTTAGGGVASSNEIVAEAQTFLGIPYVWAGESRSGVDCSGLVKLVFQKFGIQVPHLADSQAYLGQQVAKDLQPGDVIAFRYAGASTYHHVGIYVGGGQMIHAPDVGDVVRYAPLDTSYWQSMDWSIRRY